MASNSGALAFADVCIFSGRFLLSWFLQEPFPASGHPRVPWSFGEKKRDQVQAESKLGSPDLCRKVSCRYLARSQGNPGNEASIFDLDYVWER